MIFVDLGCSLSLCQAVEHNVSMGLRPMPAGGDPELLKKFLDEISLRQGDITEPLGTLSTMMNSLFLWSFKEQFKCFPHIN